MKTYEFSFRTEREEAHAFAKQLWFERGGSKEEWDEYEKEYQAEMEEDYGGYIEGLTYTEEKIGSFSPEDAEIEAYNKIKK